MRQPAYIEFPSPWVANPTVTLLGWVPVLSPNRVWQYLHYLLGLWVAIWVTICSWLLSIFCITRRAIDMVRIIWEVHSIVAGDTGPVFECVVRGALVKPVRTAPRLYLGVDYHFTVPCHICCHVTVAWLAAVFPTTSHVHEVKLTILATTLLDINCDSYFEIWRFRYLIIIMFTKLN